MRGATITIPGRPSDAGPVDPIDTRDSSDWLFEATWQLGLVEKIEDDAILTDRDRAKVRKAKLDAIDLAIDAARCARDLVEVEP
jgi:hypothetical protein